MKKILALLIACLALTLAACGDDDDDDGGGSDGGANVATQESDTGAEEAKPAGEAVTVDMKDIKFVPKNVTVTSGTTITWTNSDSVPHTVTKTGGPGPEFDSGNIDGGGEFEQTFDTKGKIDYVCTVHPGQDGSVTVE